MNPFHTHMLPAMLAAFVFSAASLAASPGQGATADTAAASKNSEYATSKPMPSTSLLDRARADSAKDPNRPAPLAETCHLQCTPWYGCQWVCVGKDIS